MSDMVRTDETDKIKEQVVNLLIQRKWHISFAESCTGGLAAAELVDVPNASLVMDASFVTYAARAKVKFLGVTQESIDQYGVVSEQVAGEMAEGTARAAGAEIGVGITGIAGPSGGTLETPVGTVCFGFCVNGKVTCATKQFGSIGRREVREASVAFVFETLRELLGTDRRKS